MKDGKWSIDWLTFHPVDLTIRFHFTDGSERLARVRPSVLIPSGDVLFSW